MQQTKAEGSHCLSGRRLPRWSSLASMVKFRRPRLTRLAKLAAVTTVLDMRRFAERRVPRSVFDFVDGAAEAEVSRARSAAAFERIEFRPRVLRDVSQVELQSTVLGRKVSLPLILAPTSFTRFLHHDGELAVASAAAKAGIPYVLSTMGTTPPRRLAERVPEGDNWFQLYLWRDREASSALLDEAAAAGYETLVLTVDVPVAGARLRDVRNGMTIPPSLSLRTLADMSRHPRWWVNLLTSEPLSFASQRSTDGTVAEMVDRVFDPRATFADLSWLRKQWHGQLVVKGIQSVHDAIDVAKCGADAIVISNHGGRQLDRSITPLEQLPAVVEAVGQRVEIYVDGGILTGADIVACLALGADACMVGRAYLYGLMSGGEAGVSRVLAILRSEAERTARLLGAGSLEQLEPESVRLRGEYGMPE